MRLKRIIITSLILSGTYWLGKMIGTYHGAKIALDKYKDIIPDEKITIDLVNNKHLSMSVIAKKEK